MKERIHSHRDLIVYQKSFAAGRRIFDLSKQFPKEEMYSLTDQIRRAARSVSANIAEAWRRRRYENHFCSTLNIAEAEAAETQVWLDYAAAHGYLDSQTAQQANEFYDEILRMIVAMINDAEKWCIKSGGEGETRREGVREQDADYLLRDEAPALDQQALLSPTPNSPSPPRTKPPRTKPPLTKPPLDQPGVRDA